MTIHKFLIDSSKRLSTSTSSADFEIKFPTSFRKAHKVKLYWLVLPLGIYQINTTNQIIYFNENSTNKTATITAGNYNATTLAAAIKTTMDTASGGYNTFTVTYSTSTYFYTISAGNAFTLRWSQNTALAAIFGFSSSDTSAATSQVSTRAVNLSAPLSLNVSIREFDDVLITGEKILQSTFTAYLREGASYVNIYEPQEDYQVAAKNAPFERMNVRLTDMSGTTLDIHNTDWTMHMCVETDPLDHEPRKKRKYD